MLRPPAWAPGPFICTRRTTDKTDLLDGNPAPLHPPPATSPPLAHHLADQLRAVGAHAHALKDGGWYRKRENRSDDSIAKTYAKADAAEPAGVQRLCRHTAPSAGVLAHGPRLLGLGHPKQPFRLQSSVPRSAWRGSPLIVGGNRPESWPGLKGPSNHDIT
jgi:hypothetical protein